MIISKFMKIMDAQTGIASAQIDYIRDEVIAKKKMEAACVGFKKILEDIESEWKDKAMEVFSSLMPDRIINWTELDCEGIIIQYFQNHSDEDIRDYLIKWEEME